MKFPLSRILLNFLKRLRYQPYGRHKGGEYMIKFLTIAIALTIVSFFLSGHSAFGQTATPTVAPTTVVPTSAPATGFGPN